MLMHITFKTVTLKERIYKRLIRRIIGQYLKSYRDQRKFLARWDITIYDKKDTNLSWFRHIKTTSGQKLNPDMPSGVTGQYEMKLFLTDNNNPMTLRENAQRVQHELMHALIYDKIGSVNNIWVKEVHRVEEENNFKNMRFLYWDSWRRFKYPIIKIGNIDKVFFDK